MISPASMQHTPFATAVIEFVIPGSVADVLDVAGIVRRARDAGVAQPRLELATMDRPLTLTRVSCDRVMAAFFVAACHELAARSRGELLVEASQAARAGLVAMDPDQP
jgi:hypothetical protein